MNAQDLNQKPNRLSYQKDYTKLESIFDEAVERMHRKRIIYYATDRIYSEDSRKFRARETFKETAWAEPVSTEDIKTEVIQLAKENVIPISDTILNDSPSMISFLELMGEDNVGQVKTARKESLVEESVKKSEKPKESSTAEAVELRDLVEPVETTDEVQMNVTPEEEKKPVEAVTLADLIPEENIETAEPEEQPNLSEKVQVKPEETDIYLRYQKIKAEAKEKEKVFQEETLVIEESATEHKESGKIEQTTETLKPVEKMQQVTEESNIIEEVELEPTETKEDSGDYLEEDYDRFLEFSDQILNNENIPDDLSLGELLASIQEDDSYLQRDETAKEQVIEIEAIDESEKADEIIEIEEEPLDELKEEVMQAQESPLDNEARESKSKRRIQLDEVETQDLYEPTTKTPKKQLSPTMIEKINGAKKEYMLSRISFFVALFLTGVFTVLFFHSFNGIDYFSLILSLIGAFLVWDLSSKRILIMTGLMEAAIIASMFYVTNSTGMPLDYFHYVWLLVVPLMISASFIFKKSRENYASIVNGKDVNLETN